MRMLLIAIAATGLTACETPLAAPERSAQDQATYDRLLAGKAAGQPLSCLPTFRSGDMVVIDDGTILFKDGKTVYVNRPEGGCGRLGSGQYALVTRSFSSRLCSGDISTVEDLTNGITVGSCALGEFVPYRPTAG